MQARLIIKIFILILFIILIMNYPIPTPCLCGDHYWWNKCLIGTEKGSISCSIIDNTPEIIKNIGRDLSDMGGNIRSIVGALSLDIPTINFNSNISSMISSAFNEINLVAPSISNINMSCNITIPFRNITSKIIDIKDKIIGDINSLSYTIQNLQILPQIENIKNQMINLKNHIETIINSLDINIPDIGDLIGKLLEQIGAAILAAAAEVDKFAKQSAAAVAKLAVETATQAVAAAKQAYEAAVTIANQAAVELTKIGEDIANFSKNLGNTIGTGVVAGVDAAGNGFVQVGNSIANFFDGGNRGGGDGCIIS